MFILLIILVALLGGETIQNYPNAENLYADHVSQFGTSLLLALNNQNHQENIIISPLSIYSALIVAGSGAYGKTLDEFRKVLHTCNDSRFNEEKNLLALAGQVTKAKKDRNSPEIYFESNSLWINSKFNINKKFINQVKTAIDVDIMELNFKLKNVSNIVNSYVEKKTKGLIKNILIRLCTPDLMILASAVSLPFELDEIEMMIILPEVKSPEALQYAAFKYLSSEGLSKIKANGNITKVHLSLPRFKTGFKTLLLEQLLQIGLVYAFTDNAEFPHISNDSLKMSNVYHQVEVKINEEGAEATATVMIFEEKENLVKNQEDESEAYFPIDRPFLVAIYDTQTNMPIFIGMIKTVGNADVEAEVKVDL
ncbi:MAG: putative proteinase inhibitor I4 serpin [Streblomastix strix]|uniref:Serpin domain-containing protein n=1 Tax=Streblomastix strix TaxID=222440 RepID=A0A5J4W687_9EUKA|nr:MAG: putative proteinase inhibitor I4 serpin [Streblomastix strix]